MPILLPQLPIFVPLWNSWGQEHPLNRQHDVREFLDYVLSVLKPTFWGGQTCPKWASGDISLEALQHRGSKWLTLTISTSHAGHDNFQHLISKWHDEEGLQQSFLIAGRAIAVHLDRRMGLDEVKTYTQILFPSNWQIELLFLIPPIDAIFLESVSTPHDEMGYAPANQRLEPKNHPREEQETRLNHPPPSWSSKAVNLHFSHGFLGGFRYFVCSPRKLGKIPILTIIFQMGGSTTNRFCFVWIICSRSCFRILVYFS